MIKHDRSAEHYARVERSRWIGEPYFVALIRVAYEDMIASGKTAQAAWELLGYISRAGAPGMLPAVEPVKAPVIEDKKRHANRGRILSEEHKAKLKAAWARRKAWAEVQAEADEPVPEPEPEPEPQHRTMADVAAAGRSHKKLPDEEVQQRRNDRLADNPFLRFNSGEAS